MKIKDYVDALIFFDTLKPFTVCIINHESPLHIGYGPILRDFLLFCADISDRGHVYIADN